MLKQPKNCSSRERGGGGGRKGRKGGGRRERERRVTSLHTFFFNPESKENFVRRHH
jgi:hypothetical protein